MDILAFLEGNFLKLPVWARVTAYFVMLVLFAYLVLAPRFINGQIVAKTKNGGFVPYRGVELQTRLDGRTMKYQTNEDGYWSIPLVSRFPESVHLQIFHEDEGAWFEATINASEVWKKFWNNEFRVTILKDPPGLKVDPVAQSNLNIAKTAEAAWFNPVAPLYAGELTLPSVAAVSRTVDAHEKKEIDKNVAKLYNDLTNKTVPEKLASVPIGGQSNLSYVERIQLIESVEQSQKLKIPDQHWKSFKTLAELSDYVYKRKVLESTNPTLYRVNQAYDWAKINATLPIDQRPQFRITDSKSASVLQNQK